MRSIIFSQHYPAYHPRKGDDTNFNMKLLKPFALPKHQPSFKEFEPKLTTIREGNNWKVGDFFQPKYWTGKPYASKQEFIRIEPLQVKKTYKFEITKKGDYKLNGKKIKYDKLKIIALNDGFEHLDDFEQWFSKKTFKGQLITWSEGINY